MKRICVYCGSSPGRVPMYREAAAALGRALTARSLGLVYGGASIGVMGAIADAVLESGGEAIGIIPEALAVKEVAHQHLTRQHVVSSMHERKAMMAELSDGFIAMPGGWGTIEELFEILTWAQLGFHEKPCGLLNVHGYFDGLFAFLEHAVEEQFVKPEYRPMLIMEDSPEDLLERFDRYRAPQVRKWLTPSQT
ncbi:MAG TPA: TIGR00730 family Rossman fold protein [Xanthomonadales bacterium]|nr:TIGR00730 family Rossman fold protein [Xanthomonadales bacterium]